MDRSPAASLVFGILRAKILKWVAMPSSKASSQLLGLLHWQACSLPLAPPGKALGKTCCCCCCCCEVAQSCPTPSDPMDCSPPGSSIHGIFQARVLEWGAIAFSEVKHNWSLIVRLKWWRIRLQCVRPGLDPCVGKIPWRRERLPSPVFWPGEFHGITNMEKFMGSQSRTQLSDCHSRSSTWSNLNLTDKTPN